MSKPVVITNARIVDPARGIDQRVDGDHAVVAILGQPLAERGRGPAYLILVRRGQSSRQLTALIAAGDDGLADVVEPDRGVPTNGELVGQVPHT